MRKRLLYIGTVRNMLSYIGIVRSRLLYIGTVRYRLLYIGTVRNRQSYVATMRNRLSYIGTDIPMFHIGVVSTVEQTEPYLHASAQHVPHRRDKRAMPVRADGH